MLKRVLTGEIVQSVGIEIMRGLGILELVLKRERSSGKPYVMLVARANGGVFYYPLELEELDRLIEAADDIRASQSSAIGAPPETNPKGGYYMDLVLTGETIRQIDTEISGGHLTMSLRLKRANKSLREHIVLATIAIGDYQHYPFELDEFHQFAAAAKKVCASAHGL